MADWRLPGFTGLRELGRGARGRVMPARDGGELVAIKYLAPELTVDERPPERFRGRVRTPARVDDPPGRHEPVFPGPAPVIRKSPAGTGRRARSPVAPAPRRRADGSLKRALSTPATTGCPFGCVSSIVW